MARLRQRVRFCNSRDGVRIAYSVVGRGTPLLMLSGGHCHLELDLASPVFGHWLAELSRRHALVRLDTRGYGLSDRDVADHSVDAIVGDLEAVVDALGLTRFALLAWMGGTPFAVAYAHRHPDLVSHLVLHAAYLRGWLRRGVDSRERAAVEALIAQVEHGWDMPDPIVRHAITASFIPDSSAAEQAWLNEALRLSAHGGDAARRLRVRLEADASAIAREVRARR
jgi:pimeloyl-ACP methyl ester carboxylesterase